MLFDNQYDAVRNVVSPPGSAEIDTYGFEITDTGVKRVVKKGKFNIYDMIQSHAKSVDMQEILTRFANGDENAFFRRQGVYIDTTEMPSTMAEFYSRMSEAQDVFAGLPAEVRSAFDNNVGKFFSLIGTPEFDRLYPQTAPVVEVENNIVKEVINDVSESNE